MPTTASHIWQPSSARVLVLDGFAPVPRGVMQAVPPMLAWPAKDPSDVLDYQLDFSDALAGDGGDTIATIDVQISPSESGDLSMQSAAAVGSTAVLWLAAGQPGTTYTVSLAVGTSSGRMLNRSVRLPVLPFGAPPLAQGVLLTEAGSPLTDQNGNALTLGG